MYPANELAGPRWSRRQRKPPSRKFAMSCPQGYAYGGGGCIRELGPIVFRGKKRRGPRGFGSWDLGELSDQDAQNLFDLFRQIFPNEANKLQAYMREKCIEGLKTEATVKAQEAMPWIMMGGGLLLAMIMSRR